MIKIHWVEVFKNSFSKYFKQSSNEDKKKKKNLPNTMSNRPAGGAQQTQ